MNFDSTNLENKSFRMVEDLVMVYKVFAFIKFSVFIVDKSSNAYDYFGKGILL